MPKVDLRSLSKEDAASLIEENKKIYTQHFNEAHSKILIDNVLDVIDELYFRSEFIGFDETEKRNNPERPLIYISNHSGMAFPWDAMIFTAKFYRLNNYKLKDSIRALVAPMLSQTKLTNPYMVGNLWKLAGGVDANYLNFETMMQYQGSNVLIYPEGVPGIGKGFNNKYQLQRFATSFVRMSLKYKTDVVPVHTVNGEYIHPHSYSIKAIDRLVNKVGVPFLPLSWVLLFLLIQPWIFYMAFPANLRYVKGKRLKPYEWVDKPYDELTEDDINAICDRIKNEMQIEMDEAVKEHGKKPFAFGNYLKGVFKNLTKYPFYFPWGWPFIFADFENRYVKNDKPFKAFKPNLLSVLKVIIKNPLVICFYIPVIGWIPLLFKAYSKIK